MWKMFDDMIECDECGGPLGAPPKFMIPPPPRPPSMSEYSLSNCNEEEMALKAQQAWDNDMCEAIPILDASLYSSQSLQTSAMIAVFSLLLVLVVLISSLFVWKNKRKVQNFLPCKTPTRGPHINGALPMNSAHAATYEDPDAHLGHHRPLVMRHHHNVEMIHGKSIHYPSGYPMTRSPPFLVSSSPGPDPYRSNDNVYEELGPGRDSDGESEPPLHSDDDFAEDELSLPGERTFNKSNVSEAQSTMPALANIYHERVTASGTLPVGPERNSVLSSSSSTQDASVATAASSSSSHNNNSNNVAISISTAPGTATTHTGVPSGLLSGMLRHTTGRSKFHTTNATRSRATASAASGEDFNTSTSTADAADISPLQQIYDNRSNLMSLGYLPQQQQHQYQLQPQQHQQPTPHAYHHSLHHVNNNNNARSLAAPQFYNTLESDVDRRNRINAQLNQSPAVATIFRERIHYPGSGRYPQPYYASNSGSGLLASSVRTRTNPRSAERRHRIAAPLDSIEPAYGYAEPLYQENYHYDTCATPSLQQRLGQPLAYTSYIMPNYTNSGACGTQPHPHHYQRHHPAATCQNATQLYSHGDSSFGSDSGYSHHTPASSIGRHDYEVTVPIPAPPPATQKTPSKLASALNFGWNRRKSTSNAPPTSLSVKHTTATSSSSNDGTEATSPNNNSACSTVTSTLEATSSSSSSAPPAVTSAVAVQNNNTPIPMPTQAPA